MKYFISYTWGDERSGRSGSGMVEMDMTAPITCFDDVRGIARWIEDNCGFGPGTTVVIVNWKELSE